MSEDKAVTNTCVDTAGAQLRRLLQIIPQLADGEEHPVEHVAQLVGVDDGAQLITDLQSLVDRFDTPGAFVEGVQVWIDDRNMSIVSNHFLRPMRLTIAELCALELGVAILRSERPAAEHAVLDHALGRLRGITTMMHEIAARDEVRAATLGGAGDTERLAELRRALDIRHKIRIRYRSGAATEATWRNVCPYGVLFASGAWYVVANCMESDGVRFFRLDRIEATEPTGERYEIPPEFVLETVASDGRVLGKTPHSTMRVRYSARIAPWIAEREGAALEADGALILEHPVHDPAWAIRHVLQYGPEAEVLAPAEMRAIVAERLEEMAATEATRPAA
jgi:proteasome accessory factor C